MPYFLPVYRANGSASASVAVNANNRVDVYNAAGTAFEVINSPDAAPSSGGKFPTFDVTGVEYPINFLFTSGGGTIISDTIGDATSGDANMISRAIVDDGNPWTIQARITDDEAKPYGYLAFTTVAVTVYDVSLGGTDIYTPTDPAPAVVFQTAPQTWSVDDFGFNFELTILNSELTGGVEGGHVYMAQAVCTLNTGGSKTVRAYFVVRPVAGS